LATKVVVMDGGVIQQVGAPQEIYDRPANSFVAKFIGSPSMNLFPAELDTVDRSVVAKVKGTNGANPILLTTPAPAGNVPIGKQVFCGIRPEAILPVQAAAPGAANILPVDIEIVEPTGSDNIAFFRLGTSEIQARLPPGSCVAGDKLLLQLPAEKLLIYDAGSGRLLF
jgi:multiple sugar transport system ATP-binding protein